MSQQQLQEQTDPGRHSMLVAAGNIIKCLQHTQLKLSNKHARKVEL